MHCVQFLWFLVTYVNGLLDRNTSPAFWCFIGTGVFFTGFWIVLLGIIAVALFLDVSVLTLKGIWLALAFTTKKTAVVVKDRRERVRQRVAAAKEKAEAEAKAKADAKRLADEEASKPTKADHLAALSDEFEEQKALIEASLSDPIKKGLELAELQAEYDEALEVIKGMR